jgi:hypothetical protein
MKSIRFGRFVYLSASLMLVLALVPAAFAQDASSQSSSRGSATVASGQKMKLKGVVTRRDADTFVVQDQTGNSYTILLNDRTSVKTKGGLFGGGTN